MKSSSSLFILLAAIVLFSGALFFVRPRAEEASSDKPVVSATIFPLYDIVREVAGEDLDVVLILPAGAEPHSFDPTPTVVRSIQRSSVVYAIGHGFDSWAEELTDGSSTPTVIVDRNVSLRETSEEVHEDEEHEGEEHADEAHEDEAGHEHGPIDPHYWLDVENAIHITETVRDDLAKRFPEKAENFRVRADAYVTSLTELDRTLTLSMQGVENPHLITFHDAWYYFAEAYGLEVIGTFEPAPGREPTPRDLAGLLSMIKEEGLQTLYTEPLFSSNAIDAFVQDNQLTVYAIDDIGGTTPETDSYIELMEWNGSIIQKNR